MDTLSPEKTKGSKAVTEDFLPLKNWDHIEFYCGNAKQSAFYYQYAMGFKLTAYSGLETGNRERLHTCLNRVK